MKRLILLISVLVPLMAASQYVQFGNTRWSTTSLGNGMYYTLQEMEANPCPSGWQVPTRDDWYRLMSYAPNKDTTIYWINSILQTTKQGYSDFGGNFHFVGIYDAFWIADHDTWLTPQGRTYTQYYSWRNLFYPGIMLKPEVHIYPDLDPLIPEETYELVNNNGQWEIDTVISYLSTYRYQIRCIERLDPEPQVYHLIKGWSYLVTPVAYSFAQFFPNPGNLMLVKDVLGNIYWPQYNVNQLPMGIEAGKLYLVRMHVTENIEVL